MLQKMEGTSRSSTPFISVLIGAATTDNVIAWNTASNTLAIAVDSHDRPGVCILDPACPEVRIHSREEEVSLATPYCKT